MSPRVRCEVASRLALVLVYRTSRYHSHTIIIEVSFFISRNQAHILDMDKYTLHAKKKHSSFGHDVTCLSVSWVVVPWCFTLSTMVVPFIEYHIATLPRYGTPVSPSIRSAPKDLGATTHLALNDLRVGRFTRDGQKHCTTTTGEGQLL